MENFSQLVRNELSHIEFSSCSGCVKAELAAAVHMAGSIHLSGQQQLSLSLTFEAAVVVRRLLKLLKTSYGLQEEVRVESVSRLGRHHRYVLHLPHQPGLAEMLSDLGVLSREHSLASTVQPELVRNHCCRAAFIRGAFLSGGSISDPNKKTYHLELVTSNEDFAASLAYLINLSGLKAKLSQRKGSYLVYLKESNALAGFLSLIGAHTALLKLEEIRVIKGMRGEVNRLVNCETANLEKTLTAAWEQIALIQQLARENRLSLLPEQLRQTAQLRLVYPEATFKELGEHHLPPLSKSAVNHRLRLIRQFAKSLHK